MKMLRRFVQSAAKLVGAVVDLGRARCLTWAGLAILAAAPCLRWHATPSPVESMVGSDGKLLALSSPSWVELVFRSFTLLAVLLVARHSLLLSGQTRKARQVALCLLAVVGTFPCWMTQWADEMNDAESLDRQLLAATVDIEENFTEQQVDWREWQTFSPATSLDGGPLLGPDRNVWGVQLFSPANWKTTLSNPLGFSNAFLTFIKPGLLAAVVGAFSLVLGLYLAESPASRAFYRECVVALACAASAVAIPITTRAIGEQYEEWGDVALAKGEHNEAVRYWQAAARWQPRMRLTGAYYDKIGQARLALGCDNCTESQVTNARTALENGKTEEAIVYLRRALANDPKAPGLPAFLAAALSMRAFEAFNAGQYSVATESFREAIHHYPTNALLWYGLSMAHLRLKHFQEARLCSAGVLELQQQRGFKSPTVQSQLLVLESWGAFHRGEWQNAHAFYCSALQPGTW
jgi:tetratricopeptide (TPR) repeat protein